MSPQNDVQSAGTHSLTIRHLTGHDQVHLGGNERVGDHVFLFDNGISIKPPVKSVFHIFVNKGQFL